MNTIFRDLFGAANQNRTGDLVLTKDALYRLSHSSEPVALTDATLAIIEHRGGFVNTFFTSLDRGEFWVPLKTEKIFSKNISKNKRKNSFKTGENGKVFGGFASFR